MNEYRFSMDMVQSFGEKLRLEEKSEATVQKYTYGICRFLGIGGPGGRIVL